MNRLFRRLWTREPRKPLNLLAPDLVCEAHFHLLADGTSRMYMNKLPPETTPGDIVRIVQGLIQQAVEFGRQHGVEVHVRTEGGA